MMRTLIIKLLMLLILVSSCSTRKLNRQKSASSASLQSEIRMQDLMKDKLEVKRKILLTDTTHEQYTVTIFPLDSFSFSAQYGFRGKAEKIEVKGMHKRVKTVSDSMMVQAESKREGIYEAEERREKKEALRGKAVDRKRWNLVIVIIVLLVLILIRWLLRRERRWNL